MFRRRLDVTRVIPGLSMGSAASARRGARLARDGIECVVDLREEGTDVDHWPPKVLVGRVPVAGIERTPMVVCAALLMLGWSLKDAYQRVTEARPESAPTAHR